METQKLLNPRELANRLGVSLKFVIKHTQTHRIPGQIKIGRLWRYDPIAIEKALLRKELLLSGGGL